MRILFILLLLLILMTPFAQANAGYALQFDGIDDMIIINDSNTLDSIADEGTLGKEAMIRIFGHSAIEVVDKAFQIAQID